MCKRLLCEFKLPRATLTFKFPVMTPLSSSTPLTPSQQELVDKFLTLTEHALVRSTVVHLGIQVFLKSNSVQDFLKKLHNHIWTQLGVQPAIGFSLLCIGLSQKIPNICTLYDDVVEQENFFLLRILCENETSKLTQILERFEQIYTLASTDLQKIIALPTDAERVCVLKPILHTHQKIEQYFSTLSSPIQVVAARMALSDQDLQMYMTAKLAYEKSAENN